MIKYQKYSPFGEPLKKNNYQPQWNESLGFIDKEKDRESKLGDHGVRKYDYEIGRFTSVDPLWEKYTGCTGYQYSLNNPVNASDGNGKFKIPKTGDIEPWSKNKSPDYKEKFPFLINLLSTAENYLLDNKDLLSKLSKLSKIPSKRILNDFKYNEGPTVFAEFFSNFGWSLGGNKFSVRAADIKEAQNFAKNGNYESAQIELTISMMTIIHEYLHILGLNDEKVDKIEKELWGDFDQTAEEEIKDAIKNGQVPLVNQSVVK